MRGDSTHMPGQRLSLAPGTQAWNMNGLDKGPVGIAFWEMRAENKFSVLLVSTDPSAMGADPARNMASLAGCCQWITGRGRKNHDPG